MRPSPSGTTPWRALPSPALTDWPMVMPSIFRAGTCFMGLSAWNSLENCGERFLVGWVAWPELAKAERPQACCPPRHLPPLGKAVARRLEVMPGRSVQYPSLQWLPSSRLHPNGLYTSPSHTGHLGTCRGPSMGKDSLATHPPGVRH